MEYKHKLILALIECLGRNLSGTDFQKLLFLFEDEATERYYDFIPYKFGCFSYESMHDKVKLISNGYLIDDEKSWKLSDRKDNYFKELNPNDKQTILNFKKRFERLRGKSLIKYVYTNYPYYAIRSEIAEDILTEKETQIIKSIKPKQTKEELFTIGYESKSIDKYINQLIFNNIRALCDVRKNPISRKYGFSKTRLQSICEKAGIEYFHFPDLGIDSSKRQSLNNQEDYEMLFKEYENTTLKNEKREIEKLSEIAKKYRRIALTCFEASHLQCHRSRLAKALTRQADWEIPLNHI
jgi:uncharacterized protein (DUF488 family)